MKLLLQPLVENSIYHGIKTIKGSTALFITIRSAKETLELTVRDTGKGISPEDLENIRDSIKEEQEEKDLSHHIGLYNTNKRLKLLYGKEYGLFIDSLPGKGTTATAVLPLHFP